MRDYNNLIRSICEECGIKLTLLTDTWVKVLEKDNRVHYIVGYKFDLNNQGESLLLDDKYATFELLNHFNIPIIKHHNILHGYDEDEVINLFKEYNSNVIIKGNEGSCGKEVHHVTDVDELITTIDDLLVSQYSVSLCPFYKIDNEYRIIVLNKEVKLMYGKINPHVVGDGIHTIKELADKFNYNFYHNKELSNDIPKKNEVITLDYRHNLSNGAMIFEDISDSIKKELMKIVKMVIKKTNIKFASIDIVEVNKEYMVMEINTGVMMSNYIKIKENGFNIAKAIYQEAIELMFKE